MKVGDKVEVSIAGHRVADAEIKEINGDKAILIVPATRVEFGIESRLADLPVESTGGSTQVIVDDVVRHTQEAPPAAPNVEGQTSEEAGTQATPPVEAGTTNAVTPVDGAQVTLSETDVAATQAGREVVKEPDNG